MNPLKLGLDVASSALSHLLPGQESNQNNNANAQNDPKNALMQILSTVAGK